MVLTVNLWKLATSKHSKKHDLKHTLKRFEEIYEEAIRLKRAEIEAEAE